MGVQYPDLFQQTLALAYTAGGSTLTLSGTTSSISDTDLPTDGDWYIAVWDPLDKINTYEVFKVTGGPSGSTIPVTGAQAGTTNKDHDTGSVCVGGIITKAFIEAFLATASGFNSPLTITTDSPLPDGEVGTAYSETLVATGGTASYLWALGGGELPTGLSLSTAGVLDGTPTAEEDKLFSVMVTDSARLAPTMKIFFLHVAEAAITTSYSNPLGSGDRSNGAGTDSPGKAKIYITTSPSLTNNNPYAAYIDGSTSSVMSFINAVAVSGLFIKFNFATKEGKYVIDEITWKQSNTATHGTWKVQGSDDDSTWTDIGSSFTLGGATTQTITTLAGNTTAYRMYRLLGVSGSTSSSGFQTEAEFKISTIQSSGSCDYTNSLGNDDRTASITVAQSTSLFNTAPSVLVNGLHANNELFFNGGSIAGAWFSFDFGSSKIIDEIRWYQSNSTSHGTWKVQGSSDNSSWTDIGGSFTLGGSLENWGTNANELVQHIRTINGNTTAYRYYRILGVSGSSSSSPWTREIEFRIN